jgi:hypothetical protein
MAEIIEGKWEDVAGRKDLLGRTVRIVVLDQAEKAAEDPWLKSLRAWIERHETRAHGVDDNRESIYSGTTDDPR